MFSSAELEALRADVSEARAKMERLQEKQKEIETETRESNAAIASAQRASQVQQESTSSEVFRLKGGLLSPCKLRRLNVHSSTDELEALQDMHMWRLTKIESAYAELVYTSRYQVCIPCKNFRPLLDDVTISPAKDLRAKERDAFPQLTALTLQQAHAVLLDRQCKNIRMVRGTGVRLCTTADLRRRYSRLSATFGHRVLNFELS